jgi:hypothetical protein
MCAVIGCEKVNFESLSPRDIIKSGSWRVPRKIVAIGGYNENWGYLSTTFLNRYCGLVTRPVY